MRWLQREIGEAELHRKRREAVEHPCPFEGDRARPIELVVRSADLELVERHVIAVRPNSDLGVIVERVADRELVSGIGSHGIAGRRDGKALNPQIRYRLAKDPAVRQVIVENDRSPIIVGLARSAEARPQRVVGDRPENLGAGGLVID